MVVQRNWLVTRRLRIKETHQTNQSRHSPTTWLLSVMQATSLLWASSLHSTKQALSCKTVKAWRLQSWSQSFWNLRWSSRQSKMHLWKQHAFKQSRSIAWPATNLKWFSLNAKSERQWTFIGLSSESMSLTTDKLVFRTGSVWVAATKM